jgi:two-component system nitrogen regulation response regulator GlnG
VIVVTAFAATETAIEAMKRGAFEYLLKPVDLHHLREVVDKAFALRRMRTVPAVFADAPAADDADRIVGQSPPMQELYKVIGRFAPQDVTVLVLGESGTGKELVARALYQHSKRAGRPFLAINCAAIPESLLESELFGHEKGAFTGADRQRVGKFEQADGGTLFLDEIGDMTPATQAKVLRVLQDQQFERVGGRETIRTDVRLIAATNQKLDDLVAAGRFRQDLLYRLNGVTILLPPLRERKEDLPALVEHLLRRQGGKLGKSVRAAAPDAMTVLEQHDWPGNIRELENAIRYGLIQTVSDVLTADCLPGNVCGRPVAPTPEVLALADLRGLVRTLLAAGSPELYRRVIHEVDRVLLDEVLAHVGGNQVHASELLGISRTTLRAKLSAKPAE